MNDRSFIRCIKRETEWTEEDGKLLLFLVREFVLCSLTRGGWVEWDRLFCAYLKKIRPVNVKGQHIYKEKKIKKMRYWKAYVSFGQIVVQVNDDLQQVYKSQLEYKKPAHSERQAGVEPMRKQDILRFLTDASGWPEAQAAEKLDYLENQIRQALAREEQVNLSGFLRAWVKPSSGTHPSGKSMREDDSRGKVRCLNVECRFQGDIARMLKEAEFNDANPGSGEKAREKVFLAWKEIYEKKGMEIRNGQEKYAGKLLKEAASRKM